METCNDLIEALRALEEAQNNKPENTLDNP